ncbi:MAG: hypothetical protein HRK26_02930 [Rickettsiaceae bacterium H1]|nr:hypothetical protein [Rickettsiaceae bacterium H1]
MTINYDFLLDQANRDLIRNALKKVNREQECNIYISFYTKNKGVIISSKLRERYPEKMAIILQHQFDNFVVKSNYFSVRLSFGGIFEIIEIPFSAIEIFHDKDANFYLKLNEENNNTIPSFEEDMENEDFDDNKIISIEKFLKK